MIFDVIVDDIEQIHELPIDAHVTSLWCLGIVSNAFVYSLHNEFFDNLNRQW